MDRLETVSLAVHSALFGGYLVWGEKICIRHGLGAVKSSRMMAAMGAMLVINKELRNTIFHDQRTDALPCGLGHWITGQIPVTIGTFAAFYGKYRMTPVVAGTISLSFAGWCIGWTAAKCLIDK